jgi:type VII secretion protein EccB
VPAVSSSPSPTDPGTRSAPATRDQVDAYRFGLRRLEAALVRGDPVPLHEQVRAQRRAVAAGVVLGVLGLAGALVTGIVNPQPEWRKNDLVVGSPSGALYAVAHDPDRLVPVANAVAGRLVLAALRGSPPEPGPPVPVDDGALATAPRTAAAAVPGAVAADPRQHLAPHWAICDEVAAAASGPRLVGTTVLAGSAPGPDPDAQAGVLLAVPGGGTWLVADGHRHRIDVRDAALRTALGLTDRVPRPASSGLVSALPEGPRLTSPVVPRAGAAGPPRVPGRVGDVLVSRPAGAPPRHYVVLADGLQEIAPLAADVLAAVSGHAVDEIGAEVVAAVAAVHVLDLSGWPAVAPRLAEPPDAPATCWAWSGDPGADLTGGVHLGRLHAGVPVPLAGADGAGEALDAVAVGAGGTVRATAPGVPAGAGTLWLVSASGVAYGVPDGASAAALGIGAPDPAPEAALRLLPTGPPLDVATANRAVDVAG